MTLHKTAPAPGPKASTIGATTPVSLRFTAAELETIDGAAARARMTRHAWMRAVLLVSSGAAEPVTKAVP